MGGGEDTVLGPPEKNVKFLSGPIKRGVRKLFRTLFSSPEILWKAKNPRLRLEGERAIRERFPSDAPPGFNEQVTVNSEQFHEALEPPNREGRAAARPPKTRKDNEMKLKIDWKALGKALWNAVKPVLLGAIGGGVIALTDGCSSLTPSSKTQSMGVYAIGVPGIAIITQSTQNEDASGGDNNAPTQVNPVTTTMSTGK